tara:strand:- start:3 stop:650 length:648 start_codon:yes stop_codon:yes gene_type:complete
MEEEIQIINENTRKEKIKSFFIKNSKNIIFLFSAIVILIIIYFVFDEFKTRSHLKIAEKYNYVVNKHKNQIINSEIENSLIEIIESKNSTYSPLALYFIIDNEIITDTNKINKYFDLIIGINFIDKEIKNLNIYKKAIFNSNFATENELIKILRPILNSDSIWKSHSLLLLSEFFFFKNNKSESKKLLNEIINDEKSNENIKLEAQKKLIRDFSD